MGPSCDICLGLYSTQIADKQHWRVKQPAELPCLSYQRWGHRTIVASQCSIMISAHDHWRAITAINHWFLPLINLFSCATKRSSNHHPPRFQESFRCQVADHQRPYICRTSHQMMCVHCWLCPNDIDPQLESRTFQRLQRWHALSPCVHVYIYI